MKRVIIAVAAIAALSGCINMAAINEKFAPVSRWYEQEYESTRFTQRYMFTTTDINIVRQGVVKAMPKIGLTVSSSASDVVGIGNPTTMFDEKECGEWIKEDNEKSKAMSGGMLSLTCSNSAKNSVITATAKMQSFKGGTLIVLDYDLMNPQAAGYGINVPKRPPPTASKMGSQKFWEYLNKELPSPVRPAKKEDLA